MAGGTEGDGKPAVHARLSASVRCVGDDRAPAATTSAWWAARRRLFAGARQGLVASAGISCRAKGYSAGTPTGTREDDAAVCLPRRAQAAAAAAAGMKEIVRLCQAREQMERVRGRRSSSSLPAVIDLIPRETHRLGSDSREGGRRHAPRCPEPTRGARRQRMHGGAVIVLGVCPKDPLPVHASVNSWETSSAEAA